LPAKLHLQPFGRESAALFLKRGFEEYHTTIIENMVNEAVERLDGIPGWLTLYGNNLAVRKLPHEKALEETVSEGIKTVRSELEHFLEGRDKVGYLAALKAAATSARWSEVKGAVKIGRGSPVNDATVHNILESLKAGTFDPSQAHHSCVRLFDFSISLRNALTRSCASVETSDPRNRDAAWDA